ncbi:hypothetical protein PTKIN_Ptkin16aG0021900 [Pterospermum kingtungense]
MAASSPAATATATPHPHPAPPKTQRGLNKPHCIQCGSVARSSNRDLEHEKFSQITILVTTWISCSGALIIPARVVAQKQKIHAIFTESKERIKNFSFNSTMYWKSGILIIPSDLKDIACGLKAGAIAALHDNIICILVSKRKLENDGVDIVQHCLKFKKDTCSFPHIEFAYHKSYLLPKTP